MLTPGTIIKATQPHVEWELPHAAPEGIYTISIKDITDDDIYYKEGEFYNNQRISPYWAIESQGYRFSLQQLIKIGYPARISRRDGRILLLETLDNEFKFQLTIVKTINGNRRVYTRL